MIRGAASSTAAPWSVARLVCRLIILPEPGRDQAFFVFSGGPVFRPANFIMKRPTLLQGLLILASIGLLLRLILSLVTA
jgi:hypothetical protein